MGSGEGRGEDQRFGQPECGKSHVCPKSLNFNITRQDQKEHFGSLNRIFSNIKGQNLGNTNRGKRRFNNL